MKIQYGFNYSLTWLHFKITCHNDNIYLPQHYFIQLCKKATFTGHRND